jgi:hypothetical protein
MCNDPKSILNGVLTGVVFGVFGIVTGVSFHLVATSAIVFATLVELTRIEKEFRDSKMSTSYQE